MVHPVSGAMSLVDVLLSVEVVVGGGGGAGAKDLWGGGEGPANQARSAFGGPVRGDACSPLGLALFSDKSAVFPTRRRPRQSMTCGGCSSPGRMWGMHHRQTRGYGRTRTAACCWALFQCTTMYRGGRFRPGKNFGTAKFRGTVHAKSGSHQNKGPKSKGWPRDDRPMTADRAFWELMVWRGFLSLPEGDDRLESVGVGLARRLGG